MQMDIFEDIPMAEDFKKAIFKVNLRAREALNDKLKVNWIDKVKVIGSEDHTAVNVKVVVDKKHKLLNGELYTIRNRAIEIPQEGGLTRANNYMREIRVIIEWKHHGIYRFSYRYGKGWEVLNY